MIDWDTQLQTDPMFAAWVQAQIGKAGVDGQAWRAECEKWRETAQAQARRLADLEQQLAKLERQTATKGKK